MPDLKGYHSFDRFRFLFLLRQVLLKIYFYVFVFFKNLIFFSCCKKGALQKFSFLRSPWVKFILLPQIGSFIDCLFCVRLFRIIFMFDDDEIFVCGTQVDLI